MEYTKHLGFAVNYKSDAASHTSIFRILIATDTCNDAGEHKWKFNAGTLKEVELLDFMTKNHSIEWQNIQIDRTGRKIVGHEASLDRFNVNNVGPHGPLIIISILKNSDNSVIGYKVADQKGQVKNIRYKELIKYGFDAKKNDKVPVQNAIYVKPIFDNNKNLVKAGHYKSYPNCSFVEEVAVKVKKPETSYEKKIDKTKNKSSLSKLSEIYNEKQIKQLALGKKHGVQIVTYANPNLSAEQMKVLREGLEDGIDVRKYAFPEYSVESMKFYNMDLKCRLDIRSYLNPEYNLSQLEELSIAAEEGLDVSKLANPSYTVKQMQEIRIRLENNVFNIEDVIDSLDEYKNKK